MGIETSIATLGITIGTTPNRAYLARHASTWASAGIAGKGSPEKST